MRTTAVVVMAMAITRRDLRSRRAGGVDCMAGEAADAPFQLFENHVRPVPRPKGRKFLVGERHRLLAF
jgi:hypothetical protein